MPAYNFQRQFGPMLLDGSKTTTIRALRKDGRVPRVGQPFSAWHGLRSKGTELIFRGEIVKVEAVKITRVAAGLGVVPRLRLDGLIIKGADLERMAKADGFESPEMMFAWFFDHHGPLFLGHRITWRRAG